MSFELAIRLTEILMGLAFIQYSLEHLPSFKYERALFTARIILSGLLIIGMATMWVTFTLFVLALVILHRFQGPYNGGADRLGLLMLSCLCLVHLAPTVYWKEIAFGYLALQVVLSYFISGWVKLVNPQWRDGRALQDVFLFSTYPVSESLRRLAGSPRLLWLLSWYVMAFEVLFPLALFSQPVLVGALVITGSFHFSNACLFGLNRFFWIWLAAYPSLLWLQERMLITL